MLTMAIMFYATDLLIGMRGALQEFMPLVAFSSLKIACNASIACWDVGLGEFKNVNLVKCLVQETKKQAARSKHKRKRPHTPPSDNGERTEISPVSDQDVSSTNIVKMRYIIHGLAEELEMDTMYRCRTLANETLSNLP